MSPLRQAELFLIGLCLLTSVQGILYPRDTETREVKTLDGIWLFRPESVFQPLQGFREKWFNTSFRLMDSKDVIQMPVPSSYNDITQNASIRDHVGYVWYQTEKIVPFGWQNKRVVLRFGSAHYNTVVYVNGVNAFNHSGGHLPFEGEITKLIKFGSNNLITVALDNTLTEDTIPQGYVTRHENDDNYPPDFIKQNVYFDFFNYAGIHRSVQLYTTSTTYLKDLWIYTNFTDKVANVNYKWNITQSEKINCVVNIIDVEGKRVNLRYTDTCDDGSIPIYNYKLWWLYTMSDSPGYQYTFEVKLISTADGQVLDVYRTKFGIRSIRVQNTTILLNEKPLYFTGFGKHEDANIRGKGLDNALLVKDINLIKWLGANSFRTSHYPYSEELMDLCDEHGIAVIDETPAVALQSYGKKLMEDHKYRLYEMFMRDRNRPSVLVWSVANEPTSYKNESDNYFKEVTDYIRTLDNGMRLVSAALNADARSDKAGKHMDFIMHNQYVSWYSDCGRLDVVERQVYNIYTENYNVYKKPIMISEYGADTVAGLHQSPSFVFTEDYQSELLMRHHRAFDRLRNEGFFVGEHIWNFADFMTDQGITRVVGNRKGVLTRERQPKASAKILRCRYHSLMGKLDQDDYNFYCPASTTQS